MRRYDYYYVDKCFAGAVLKRGGDLEIVKMNCEREAKDNFYGNKPHSYRAQNAIYYIKPRGTPDEATRNNKA